jgi:hypothetical protein
MNWEAAGAIAEIVGGLAVIISILYLAMQVKESRMLALAQSQREIMSAAPALWSPFSTVPTATTDFRNGLNRYEDLDPDSQARFTHLLWPIMHHVELLHMMHGKGLMDEPSYERWMAGLVGITNTEGGAAWWKRIRVMVGPEFVAALDHMRDTSELPYTITDTWHFYNSDSLDSQIP